MSSDKQILSGHGFQQQLQLGWGGKVKAAKITMSAAGKNQNINNARWLKVIKMYRDYLIRRN